MCTTMAGPQYGGLLLHQAHSGPAKEKWLGRRKPPPHLQQALSRLPEDEPFELWQQAYAILVERVWTLNDQSPVIAASQGFSIRDVGWHNWGLRGNVDFRRNFHDFVTLDASAWNWRPLGPAVDPDLGAEQLAELHQVQSGHCAGFGRQGRGTKGQGHPTTIRSPSHPCLQ